jgi:hypothetical protein
VPSARLDVSAYFAPCVALLALRLTDAAALCRAARCFALRLTTLQSFAVRGAALRSSGVTRLCLPQLGSVRTCGEREALGPHAGGAGVRGPRRRSAQREHAGRVATLRGGATQALVFGLDLRFDTHRLARRDRDALKTEKKVPVAGSVVRDHAAEVGAGGTDECDE